MFTVASSIGRVLAAHRRAEQARQERIASERLQVSRFCSETVVPAFRELGREFEQHGREVEVRRDGNFVAITVCHGGRLEFRYAILATRRRRSGTGGRYRDETGYGRAVDRIYSLREAKRLGKRAIAKHLVAAYRKTLATVRTV